MGKWSEMNADLITAHSHTCQQDVNGIKAHTNISKTTLLCKVALKKNSESQHKKTLEELFNEATWEKAHMI